MKKLKGFLKLIKIFLALPRPKKEALLEIAASSIGLHGEPFTFFEDGLCTIHNSDFCNEPRFRRAYAKGRSTDSWRGWELRWRAYLYCCLAEHAGSLDGDFVECGANLGGNAEMLTGFLSFPKIKKRLLLFDTFSGFDSTLLSDEERQMTSRFYSYRNCLTEVRQRFRKLPFVKIVQGSVPASLRSVKFKKICFLSIDMNCVAPEIAAFQYLWPFISPGGIVLLDDYGFKNHFRQKEAFDRLSSQMNFRIIQLPTGQGLVVKSFG